MTTSEWDPEAHARARRIAEREALFGDLLAAVGVTPPEDPITEPIPVIRPDDFPSSWLTAR